jgi:hypothetical protein
MLDAFARGYTSQRYPPRPSRQFVSRSARVMLGELFKGREDEILASPNYRLHILTVRGRWPLTRDSSFGTPFGFGMAALATRSTAGTSRASSIAPCSTMRASIRRSSPRATSPRPAAHALRRIPHALRRARPREPERGARRLRVDPDGARRRGRYPAAPAGVYWDGGIIDYHLHLPYHHAKGLVLYPHFIDRIIPGWLDKALPWRRARGEWLDNVVLVRLRRVRREAALRKAAEPRNFRSSRATTRRARSTGALRSPKASGWRTHSSHSRGSPTPRSCRRSDP